ncbi:hypothetical protein [Lysinibacillus fusiformis]|uniref:hypothetical protein n=1 Tax=Lysinibacillus fusiformis TaxID=28031 RepID=UPI002E24FD44|nr:hypothetical protein [Lysinibacillus fusiformis]
MITKKPDKKIIGAKTRAALEKQIKAEERGRWYPISEIKFFEYEARPYQVLLKYRKGAKKNELNKTI